MDRDLTTQDKNRQRFLYWLRPVALLIIVLLVLAWVARTLEPAVEISKVRLATTERRDLEAVLTASGLVQPAAEQVMTSPVDARLLRVLRQPGSRVEAGDALMELDLSDTELALAQLQGRIEQARARRAERRLQLEKETFELRNQRKIRQLELEEARFQLEQERRLHEEGLLSLSSLRRIETRVKRLQIESEGLLESQDNAEASARAQLDGLDAELGNLADERDQMRRVLERATARAERSGVITWVLPDEGAMVRSGEPLARLADLGGFRLEASASDVHASRLSPGQQVRVPLGDDSLPGRISRILPAVDQGAVHFWVELETPDHPKLRPNLRLDVLVVTATRQQVVTLEKGPFANGPGEHEVFVVDPEGRSAQRRSITLGVAGNRRWEVQSGLSLGERVIVSDLSRFHQLETLELR